MNGFLDEIYRRPVEDLIISTGNVYGLNYHTVEPVGGDWRKMVAWCVEQYGVGGDVWAQVPGGYRWYVNNAKFWFRDKRDLTMFILKWR